ITFFEHVFKTILELFEFRQAYVFHVRVIGVYSTIILMIVFCHIELLEGHDLCHYSTGKLSRTVQLLFIRLRSLFLRFTMIQDNGTILWPHIRTLTVECSRVMHVKKYFEE